MSRYIIGFVAGFTTATYSSKKMFYYFQYYLPEYLNPMIEQPVNTSTNDHHWRKAHEERKERNKKYYNDLRIKINE